MKAGTIKAYAVTSKKRWFAAPELPTADEAGVPGLDLSNWLGAYAPKGTPKDIVAKLNKAFATAMADPDVRQRIADQGMEIPPPEQQTPEAFAVYLKSRDGQMGRGGPRVRHQGAMITLRRPAPDSIGQDRSTLLTFSVLCRRSIVRGGERQRSAIWGPP